MIFDPVSSRIFKFEREEHHFDKEVDITEQIDRRLLGVREMKIQSKDWLKRMRNSIYKLKLEDKKANRRLTCASCNYYSF